MINQQLSMTTASGKLVFAPDTQTLTVGAHDENGIPMGTADLPLSYRELQELQAFARMCADMVQPDEESIDAE